MKNICLFAAILISSLSSANLYAQNNTDSSDKSVTARLDEFFKTEVKAFQFNGSALVARKGKILLQKGYGWKNAAGNTLNDSNSIFQIGSVTKTFTAALILKLQEQGKLSVHDPLSKYIPDYPRGDQISLQELLTHSSGIFSFGTDDQDTIAWKPMSKSDVLSYFENHPLEFQPGTKFSYSNSGYFLLGMVIEKITGHPYEQVVREMIFNPFQMAHSGFDFIHLQDTLKVTGYSLLNADKQIPAHLTDSTVSYAAGAIYSTTGDLYKWATLMENKQFLSADSWKSAVTPFKAGYGYGWFIDSLNGHPYFGHGGGIPGFSAYLIYFPERDVTIVLLNNFLSDTITLLPLIYRISDMLLPPADKSLQNHEGSILDESILDSYIGTYSLTTSPKRTIIVSKQDHYLTANISGQATIPLVFQTVTEFTFKNVPNAKGKFIKENGIVTKIIVDQNGEFVWKKIQ